ncbi:MAG: hypothetical protein II655_02945, partial [Thermoguttaceae bacterium]|nr:hypothetical protein [Thermoguttaceae bacterium]
NLWNVYYAPLLTNTTSKIEYGTPIAIPGAVSLSLDPTGENTPFYADGVEYYTISNNMGYSGDLEIALIPESFRVDILKESPDSNKVLIENKDINARPSKAQIQTVLSGVEPTILGNSSERTGAFFTPYIRLTSGPERTSPRYPITSRLT